ncbi:MAG: hypothetical protein IPI95_12305 [Flavobacteriales bacterium]|nr:hypothetical protein [Flavobacteriales bacterium]
MRGEVRNPVLQWLIYGHVWVALAVAAQILWTTMFLHEGALAQRYALAAFLGSFTAYGVMRLARIKGPEGEEYANLIWYRSNKMVMNVLVGLCGIAAFLLLWPLWSKIWQMMVPAVVLTFFYVTPFTSSKGIGIGLRMVPFLKALPIAGLWAIVTVAIPLHLDPVGFTGFTVIALTCMRVPLILSPGHPLRRPRPGQRRSRPAHRAHRFRHPGGERHRAVLPAVLRSVRGDLPARPRLHDGLVGDPDRLYVRVVLTVRAKPERDAFYYAILVDGVMIAVPLCAWAGVMLG